MPIFKRFEEAWPKMDHINLLIAGDIVMRTLESDLKSIFAFTQSVLDKKEVLPDDYRKFLILSQTFLSKFNGNVQFAPPAPVHHAKWVAKAISCFKMYFFRN